MAEYLVLHSPACSLVLELPLGEAPLWRYWGPRLPDDVDPGEGLRDARPEPSFSLAFDQPLSVLPGLGDAWFGQSGLLAQRDGRDWSWRPDECRIERPDSARALIRLEDTVARIGATIALHLDPATDVLTVATTLTNAGDTTLAVQWLAAACLPLPPDARAVHSYAGRHNAEFVPVEDALTRSLWRRENRRGLTSHDCYPGALVACADGTAYGAQIAWSGNHAQTIEWLDDRRRQWQLGEWLAPGEIRLAPAESLTTPDVLATCSSAGIDGVAQAFHRAVRARITWPGDAMRPRPVHLNSWEGFYFDHDVTALGDLAEAAAALGVERFVLDDGWFAGRDDDTSSLGDWWPDPRKYPDGLRPLADRVVALGMEFGLWVEPEMVSPDSELYRAHPDWALHIAGRAPLAARNQLMLDLARPDVSDYLFNRIAALLADLPIGYLKWDHNRDVTQAGDSPRYRAQVLAAYALMARLRAAFPAVEIEACAGGGGRIDAGIVAHAHRFWASDCLDPIERMRVQRGLLRFMPPEVMGSHVGASPAHSTGRMAAMAFRCGVALPGHFGVELDPRTLAPADRATLAAGIARYKALRLRLHAGRVWQGEEADDGVVWQAHGPAGADDAPPPALVLLVTRTRSTTHRHPPLVRLAMLARGGRYRLTREGANDAALDGAWLARVGMPLPPMHAEEVLVWELEAA